MNSSALNDMETVYNNYVSKPSVQNYSLLNELFKKCTYIHTIDKIPSKNELKAFGVKVFESEQNFVEYLFSRPQALNRKMPIEFLTNEEGAQVKMNELGRIEYGVW